MAQGDAWKLAVGVKIPNHSFRFPTNWASTLNGAHTSGVNLNITDTGPDFDKTLRVGDKIRVGPSTYSGSEGAVEVRDIIAIDSATPPIYVTMDSALTYDYSSGDPVFAVATARAGAWMLDNITTVDCLGIGNGEGYDDDWAQKLDATSWSSGNYYNDLGHVAVLASVVYKFGLFYKLGALSSGTPAVFVRDLGDTGKCSVALSQQADWTHGTATQAMSSSGSSDTIIKLWDGGSGTTFSNLFFDCMYLQHADGSSGAASGEYTFTEYPDLGSVVWNYMSGMQRRRLLNNALVEFDPSGMGERSRKIELKTSFSHVSQAFWDDLMVLKDWQDKGNLLNLWPSLDDLPPLIQGRVEIGNAGKDLWDLSKRSFQLVFREA